MKDKLKQFWNEPVNRFWLTCAFGTLFALCFGIYSFFEKSLNPVISLGLISIALIFEILFLIALIINTLADTTREYLEAFQEINRDLRYAQYQKKNKKKDYKGSEWNDEEFAKITDLKERVDAFVKASIEYQQVDFKRWKKRNVGINLDTRDETLVRSFLIILAGAFSVSILAYLGWFNYLSASKLAALTDTSRSFFTIPAALIGTLVASPVIFMVWMFRDKNNRIQIENARKDTNLKDFQKLSEWASGFHLPEIKQTTTTKITNKTTKDIQENTEETTTSQEDFLAPEGSNSISRRQGAEALQASAIAQLEAFMFGKYGEQFMQPAFLLIHAIWESILTQQQTRFPDEQKFKRSLEYLYRNPIFSALNKALVSANGAHLKLFEESLRGLNLSGINSEQPTLQQWQHAGSNLENINLSYGILTHAQLQGINLNYAELHNTKFSYSDLHGARLNSSNLKKAILNYSYMRCVDLESSDLTNASFNGADLQLSILDECCLTNTNFSFANLKGVSLQGSNVEQAIFKNACINRYTLFSEGNAVDDFIAYGENEIRENVLSRGAIWDDDPSWLIGKIKDKELLKKIFQDCQERMEYPY
ncbi:MAG: pentapeptide repeat-containing protein [Moraxellaceae bacterium]|nr:MAG: pentapeptide repeat-containing protein [Moraxellaceae bacterium]